MLSGISLLGEAFIKPFTGLIGADLLNPFSSGPPALGAGQRRTMPCNLTNPSVNTPATTTTKPSDIANPANGQKGLSEWLVGILDRMVSLMEKMNATLTELSAKVSAPATDSGAAAGTATDPSETGAAAGSTGTSGATASTPSKDLGKTGQFLWKPTSEKDGKLVILLPNKLTGKVKSVNVLSPDGSKVLAKGKYANIGNGDRTHYRFTKAGSTFPKGALVEITLNDGSTRRVKISDPSKRFTK